MSAPSAQEQPSNQSAPPSGAPPAVGGDNPTAAQAPAGTAPPTGAYPPPGPSPALYAPPAQPPTGPYPPYFGAPAGQYPPPAGAPPAGQYPPPAGAPPQAGGYPGYYPPIPPPAGYPAYPGYAGYPGYPGQAPSPGGYYPAYGGAPYPYAAQAPPSPSGGTALPIPYTAGATPAGFMPAGFPAAPAAVSPYGVGVGGVGGGFPGGPGQLWYLGAQIVDPNAPPAPLGATKVPGYDPAPDFARLGKIMTVSNGDAELQAAKVLVPLTVQQRDALNDYATAKVGKSITEYLSQYFVSDHAVLIVRALVLGPLWFDVELLKKAISGFGTDDMVLTELILNRPQEEVRLLVHAYKQRYGRDLLDAVKSSYSGNLERLFVMALNTQRAPDTVPVDHAQVAADVETLTHAQKKREELPFIEIFVNRSQPHVAAVITLFGQRYKSLSKVIKKAFSGHVQTALLYILHGVKPKRDGQGIWRDAKLLEKSMAGLGTRDNQLIYRVVRAHWNRQRFEAVKGAFKSRYGKALEGRVRGETSGVYRDVILYVIKGAEGGGVGQAVGQHGHGEAVPKH